ncbi:serine hydrolase [Fodinicurvata sediminis]|uniref:serine hydrolase n=1 Tax=Fodinicurvata sediminis TaxID=1121832 RepID=UPI0003F89AFA|nr:serine hydrolase [Fodinicurvata sediminis]
MQRYPGTTGDGQGYSSISRRSLLQGVGAATAVSAISAGTASAGQQEAPEILQEATQSPPQTVGVLSAPSLVDEALSQLDGICRDILQRSEIPGLAVSVVRGGETVFAEGYGLRRIGAGEGVDADTVFQIASCSKSLGATVVASQVDAGLVTWDMPVRTLLPWFELADPWVTEHVTLGDLYAHRSGLPDHGGDDLEDLGYDRRTILERLRYLPLHSFRAHYAYTNFGLTAAAEAVAEAAGQDWASLCEASLYRPLGMDMTSSRYSDYQSRSNRAHGHVSIKGNYQPRYQRQPDAQTPAGGVSSSVRDMAKWMALILQGGRFEDRQVVTQEALLPATSAQVISAHPHAMDARAGTYGFGFGVGTEASGRVSLSHSGAFALGVGSNYVMIPSLGLGITILTNAAPTGAGEAISASFMDLAQFGSITRDWFSAYQPLMEPIVAPVGSLVGRSRPVDAAAPRAYSSYAGRYHSAYFGEASVVERAGDLYLFLGPDREENRLESWDGDSFIYRPLGENAPDGSVSRVSFSDFQNGQAGAVTVEFLDQNGLGHFTR